MTASLSLDLDIGQAAPRRWYGTQRGFAPRLVPPLARRGIVLRPQGLGEPARGGHPRHHDRPATGAGHWAAETEARPARARSRAELGRRGRREGAAGGRGKTAGQRGWVALRGGSSTPEHARRRPPPPRPRPRPPRGSTTARTGEGFAGHPAHATRRPPTTSPRRSAIVGSPSVKMERLRLTGLHVREGWCVRERRARAVHRAKQEARE